jgi:dienelactone hydrolase
MRYPAALLALALATAGCLPAQEHAASKPPPSPPKVEAPKPPDAGVRLTRPTPILARIDGVKHKIQWSAYMSKTGRRIAVYLAFPAQEGPAPAVIVVPDSRGITDSARAVAETLAEKGFLALVPEVGENSSEGEDHYISRPIVAADVLAGASQFLKNLRSCSGSIGVIGLGQGARDACALDPFPDAAALVYYGEAPDSAGGDPDCSTGARWLEFPPSVSEDFLLTAENDPADTAAKDLAAKTWEFIGRTVTAKLLPPTPTCPTCGGNP